MGKQNLALIDYLEHHPEGITIFEAMFNLGIGCLHKRLSEIEAEVSRRGWVIEDEWETTDKGARVKRHRLTHVAYG